MYVSEMCSTPSDTCQEIQCPQSSAAAPYLPGRNPLLFFASLTLRICFLFLKRRSNTLTGFPYRITSLLCSVFREKILTGSMALCLLKFLRKFSEQLLRLFLQGTWLCSMVSLFHRSEQVCSKRKGGNKYYTFQRSWEELL